MREESAAFIDHPIRPEAGREAAAQPSSSSPTGADVLEALHVDRLATVGFLASQCNHEARNRLEVIRAALELLAAGQEHTLTAADRAFLLKEAEDYIRHLELHLDMARAGAGPIEAVSVAAVVDEALVALKPVMVQSQVDLSVQVASCATVHGSRRLLRQVLLNVLRNALDSVYGNPRPRIEIRGGLDAGSVVLNVEDNGGGVDLLHQARLFEEFATTKRHGTGLGLAICRKIIRDLRGEIAFVAPETLTGANLRITLPRA